MVTRIPVLHEDSWAPGIELLWIPLGAGGGGRVVRGSGRAYEALVARRRHRPSQPPCATWGRDDLGTGDLWNSNSLVSWLLARSRHEVSGLEPPDDGRAAGWFEWSRARSRR